MHGSLLFTLEVTQEVDAGNHRKIYNSIPKKAESLSEAPIAMVAHIGKQTNNKIGCKKKDKPENVIPDRKQQPHHIGK
jgi:hypothetical protein